MLSHKRCPLFGHKNVILRLIEGYKESRCLWKVTHRDYRNYKVKSKAWDKLLYIYKEEKPNATQSEVKSKLFTLRQKYVRLRRRTLEEPSFVPKWWYYRYLNFLASQVRVNPQSTPKKGSESDGDVPEKDEETNFNNALTQLLKFLPFEQRPAARNFITEITNRAKMHQMGVLKLSMGVGDNDVTLISNSAPICSMSRPFYTGVTAEKLEKQDIAETQNAVNSLRFYFNEPNDNFDSTAIVIDNDD